MLVKAEVGDYVAAHWTREARRMETVPILRLDAFAQENNLPACRLVKVDIEGAELMFLRGGASFLSAHRPLIYGEFNSIWMKRFGHSFVDVAALAAPWGYQFFRKVGPRKFARIIEPQEGMEDVLLLPEDTQAAMRTRLGLFA